MVGHGHFSIAAKGLRRRGRLFAGGANIRRDCLTFFPAHGVRDAHHRSKVERSQDSRRRHLLQRLTRRDTRINLFMANRAPGSIDFFTLHSSMKRTERKTKHRSPARQSPTRERYMVGTLSQFAAKIQYDLAMDLKTEYVTLRSTTAPQCVLTSRGRRRVSLAQVCWSSRKRWSQRAYSRRYRTLRAARLSVHRSRAVSPDRPRFRSGLHRLRGRGAALYRFEGSRN